MIGVVGSGGGGGSSIKKPKLGREPYSLKKQFKQFSLPIRRQRELVEYLERFIRSLIETQVETFSYTPEKPARRREKKYVIDRRIMLPTYDISVKRDLLKILLVIDVSGSMDSYISKIIYFLGVLIGSLSSYNIKTHISAFLLVAGSTTVLIYKGNVDGGFLIASYDVEDENKSFYRGSIKVDLMQYDKKGKENILVSKETFDSINHFKLVEYIHKKYKIIFPFTVNPLEIKRDYERFYRLLYHALQTLQGGGSVFTNAYRIIHRFNEIIDFDIMIELTDLEIDIGPPYNLSNDFCKLHAKVPFILFTLPEVYTDIGNPVSDLLKETIKEYNLKEGEHYVIGSLYAMESFHNFLR
ncbi:MAG: hypothetical protein RMJ67_01190 [Elusimicrobiota bacterium]|nr:hypothetical protein [Endomicrobiia bacterium]MDW8165118.1 hypothetical protein [Elusimicrobiota bacterium]